jgi:hypothetical protein
MSRDVSRSTRCARLGQALDLAAAPLLNGCNVTLPLDMTRTLTRDPLCAAKQSLVMRAIWKGSISFGLVNIPIALYRRPDAKRQVKVELAKYTRS